MLKPVQIHAFSCEKGGEPRLTKDAYECYEKLEPIPLMSTLLLTITFLAILYGLTWHDRPARESEEASRSPGKTPKE